jgi:hypothetical protein
LKSDELKNFLKHFGWISNINARWKVEKVKRVYYQTVGYYAERKAKRSFEDLLSARSGNQILKLKNLDRRPNIFFLGTDEEQDRSGILQALNRIGNLSYFIRADGSYGQNDPAPPKKRKKANTQRLRELTKEFSDQGQTLDLLIAQTWGGVVEPRVFREIREACGTFVINIAMDDRHQYWGRKVNGSWDGTFPLIPHIDLTLTAAPECVEWYQKEGCPAIFFPEASDPEIFHPMPDLPKIHEVCFVGGRYGIREKLVQTLEGAGVRVTTYGSGWKNGRIATAAVPRLFAQSKIILGVGTIGHCTDFYSLKMRDFDGPMSGSFYLTHDNPDLYALYDVGKEIETYRSIEECVEKAVFYLRDDDAREKIAMAGCKRAYREHTWDKRFSDLFAVLEIDDTKK